MSGRPILVYGPAGVGVVEYAREFGWGYIVDLPDRQKLKEAVLRLINDQQFRQQLVETASAVAEANHNAGNVRERLRLLLCDAANGQPVDDHIPASLELNAV